MGSDRSKADIFSRAAAPSSSAAPSPGVGGPFTLSFTDGKLLMTVGGVPVALQLVQKLTFVIDAETMFPRLSLEFVVPDLDIATDTVQVGAVAVPLTKPMTADFADRVHYNLNAARTALLASPSFVPDAECRFADGPLGTCTRFGLFNMIAMFMTTRVGAAPAAVYLTAANEHGMRDWPDYEWGGPSPFANGARPATLFTLKVHYDAAAFRLE